MPGGRKSGVEAARANAWRFVHENSLTLAFLAIFFGAVVGQAIAGHSLYNQEQMEHGAEPTGFWGYVFSSSFGQAVMENWQSEYLQFALFGLLTVWFVQRGSPESKEVHKAGTESDKDQLIGPHSDADSPLWARTGGLRTALYSNSLIIVMAVIFLGSWFAHSVTQWTEFNQMQGLHDQAPVSWWSFVGSSAFWEATLQNWQSEFLAVGSFVVLTVFLRQRGSPESKPVGAAHDDTGVEG